MPSVTPDSSPNLPDAAPAAQPARALWPLVAKAPLPRLHVLSDVHLESGPYEIPSDLDYDILVAAGDIGPVEVAVPWLAKQGRPVVYVLGNHERWGTDFEGAVVQAKALAKGTQVHVLEKGQVFLQGVRFLGATLWTDLRGLDPQAEADVARFMRDYVFIEGGQWMQSPANVRQLKALYRRLHGSALPAKRLTREMICPLVPYLEHQRTLAWLKKKLSQQYSGPTVVVSHHAPTFESLRQSGTHQETLDCQRWSYNDNTPARIAGYASEALGTLGGKSQVALWVHGHIHVGVDFCEAGVRVLTNPRGQHRPARNDQDQRDLALMGFAFSAEDASKVNPYRGSAPGFDAGLVVQLEDGLAAPLSRLGGRALEQIQGALQGLEELLPFAGRGVGVRSRCVTESFKARLGTIDKALRDTQGLVATHLGVARGQGTRQLCHSGRTAPLRPADFRAEFARAQAVLDWVRGAPELARAGLQEWAVRSLRVLDQLQSKGVRARVAQPRANALHNCDQHSRIWILLDEPSMSTAPDDSQAAATALDNAHMALEDELTLAANDGHARTYSVHLSDDAFRRARSLSRLALRRYLAGP